jgi:nucleoid DNA-binding protein
VNREELIKEMSWEAELEAAEAARVLWAMEQVVIEALAEGDEVALTNFGTFAARARAERWGIHPQTRQPLFIPATVVPTFHPAQRLKERIARRRRYW